MKEEKVSIETMLMPKFYDDFSCLAGDCQDDCCHAWRINFDKKDYLSMRRENTPPEFKKRLNNAICRYRKTTPQDSENHWYAHFQLDENSRCLMQDPDGLCSIQKMCGHQALPHICQTYPRIIRYTPAAKEFSLSPDCEAVLALLWDLPQGIDFVETPLDESEQGVLLLEGSEGLFPVVRSVCVDILQARALTLPQRLIFLGMVLWELHGMDLSRLDLDGWAAHTAALLDDPATEANLKGIPGNVNSFLTWNIFSALKLLQGGETWIQELLDTLRVSLHSNEKTGKFSARYDASIYEQCRASLDEVLKGREYFFENLLVTIVIHLSFPRINNRESLWESYINLCNLYSFLRFVSVAGCGKLPARERLFHILVKANRILVHNDIYRTSLRNEFFRHDSATLAHMAVLVSH